MDCIRILGDSKGLHKNFEGILMDFKGFRGIVIDFIRILTLTILKPTEGLGGFLRGSMKWVCVCVCKNDDTTHLQIRYMVFYSLSGFRGSICGRF